MTRLPPSFPMLRPACLSLLLLILNLISSSPPSLAPSPRFLSGQWKALLPLAYAGTHVELPSSEATTFLTSLRQTRPGMRAGPSAMALLVCISSSPRNPQLWPHNTDLQVFLSQDSVPLPVYPLFRYVQSGLRTTFLPQWFSSLKTCFKKLPGNLILCQLFHG